MIRHKRMCGPEVFIEAQKALCNRAAGGCCHLSPKALFWAHISVQSGCRGLLPLVTKSIVLGPHVRAIGLPGVAATCHKKHWFRPTFPCHRAAGDGVVLLSPLVTKSIALGPHFRAIGLPGVVLCC